MSSSPQQQRLLLFEIGPSLFAMPIEGVHEVAEMSEMACVPTLSRSAGGVVNYRGDALPLVRRERLLALGDAELPEPGHVLVVNDGPAGGPRLGLNVDRVLGLVDGPGAVSREADPVAEKRPIDGRLTHILDPARLVARAREVIEGSLGRGE